MQFFLVVAISLPAQQSGNAGSKNSPGPSWEGLAARAKALELAPALTDNATAVERKGKRDELFAMLKSLASDAHDFSLGRGSDPEAINARELEISCLIRVANGGGGDVGLKDAVGRFRNNAGIEKERRARIASLYEFTTVRRAHKPNEGLLSAMEQAARALQKEFPDQPQGYETLLAVAGASDDVRYRDILFDLWQSAAPAPLKFQVRRLLDRHFLVGDDLYAAFADAGVPELSEVLVKGKPTVIYFWDSANPRWLELAAMLAARETVGFTLMGVSLDADPATARQAAKDQALPGRQHHDSRGRGGLLALRLKVDSAPAVILADGAGKIIDTRGESDLAAKLDRLGK